MPHPAPAPATALALLDVVRWVPSLLLGAAVAWAGLGTAGRVLASLVGLLLWLGSTVVTTVVKPRGVTGAPA